MPGVTAVCLSVAGMCLHFRGAERVRLSTPRENYSAFLRASPADGPCIDTVEMEVIEGEVPRPDLLEPVFDTGDAWELWADDRRCVFRTRRREASGHPLWSMTIDRGFNHGRIYCSKEAFVSSGKSMLAQNIVQYPLDQLLMIHTAAARSAALLLHAAGGSIDGNGVLFAGRSGAGKSTVSRLLGHNNGDGARFLSDDRVMLRRFGGKLSMYGTPWPGDAGIAINESVPLKAVCFLRHADDTTLIDLFHGPPDGRNVDHVAYVTNGVDFDRFVSEHGDIVEVGPADLFGARGQGRGVYIRDPDGNRVEIRTYE